jgi:hypothetical protein
MENMKLAICTWNELVAPVFDVSESVIMVNMSSGRAKTRKREDISGLDLLARIRRLSDLRVETLVCGAISRPWHDIITAWDIQVISYISGPVKQVLDVLLKDSMNLDKFMMPGCPESIHTHNLEVIARVAQTKQARPRCGKKILINYQNN